MRISDWSSDVCSSDLAARSGERIQLSWRLSCAQDGGAQRHRHARGHRRPGVDLPRRRPQQNHHLLKFEAIPMSNRFFSYRDGRLHASGVALDALAAEVGTPFYCYAADALEHGYRHFAAALSGLAATFCYALKANSNQAVIATFAALGAGADVVSEGELRRALADRKSPG